jgi:hypothetical protein
MKIFQPVIAAWHKMTDSTVTVPSMDGALKPNRALEEAPVLVSLPSPDNLAASQGPTFFSSGSKVFRMDGSTAEAQVFAEFDSTVACLAAIPDGGIIAGLLDGSLHVRGGGFDGLVVSSIEGGPIVCPTAMVCPDMKSLLLCIGSSVNPPDRWRRDLLDGRRSGSVWRIDLEKIAGECLASHLAFPYGIMVTRNNQVVVAESWRYRLIGLRPGGGVDVLLDQLPGYPARIVPALESDGAWLCIFAPRRPVIELILQEKGLRKAMMREVEEKYWMAPALSSGADFREPLLGGAIKQLGILKPWAPTRSYGLLLRLNESFQPIASFHSRGDGKRHGITSCLDSGDKVLVTSKGSDTIVSIDNSVVRYES